MARPRTGEEAGAKLALLERYSSQMLATARRYSDNLDDAEDAYQRAAEILLTNAPDRPADDMCRWLRTTVKHEAIAIRRQRERTVPMGAPELVPEPSGGRMSTHERVERFEQLQLGAQALRRLKPQEVRCLVLKAQGYTYNEICAETGWSYTKVDRCLKEGRSAFAARFAGIEAGDECGRVAPVLSAIVDGEATPEQIADVRPHLRTCLACRARLVEYRAAPARVAALVPPAAFAATGEGGGLRTLAESAVAAAGDRGHQFAELAAGQKAAAVAASAAALAGGGAASVDGLAGRPVEPVREMQAAPNAKTSEPPAPVLPPPASPDPAPPPPPAAAPKPPAVREEPQPAREFSPSAGAAPNPAPAAGDFTPSGSVASGRGEFSP